MRWYFEQHRGPDQRDDDDNAAPGLVGLPASLLQRHGARVLNPPDAAAIKGPRPPRSTIYRSKTLLVPDDLLRAPDFLQAINRALARVGMSLVRPGQEDEPEIGKAPYTADELRRLPRTAVLVPAAEDSAAALPVVVDAWVALQALRAAAEPDEHAVLSEEAVSRISLEHLLVGSAITGSPASDGGGVSGSPASDGGGVTGPGTADSYLYGGRDARTPVDFCLAAPDRETREYESHYGRRPVVAVLDTGVRAHPWLDVHRDRAELFGYRTEPDGFVAVDQGIQDDIYRLGGQAAGAGDQPRQLIEDPYDRPITADPLVGELDTHTGHGTFIAGIVRQVAPVARVLSIRIMHSDGIVYEGDLTSALGLIADRVAAALNGDMTQMVDVVSLSLGYFSETAADQVYTSGLREAIDILLGMGVAVTAAAGNYSTSRRFYPAAFAAQRAVGQMPVVSVGALNPNASKALFSDGGRWILAWVSGAALVSTFPTDINGSRDPEVSLPAHPANGVAPDRWPHSHREALDPDDYSGGFAVWSGTSFATPLLAGLLAGGLLAGAADGLRLNAVGADAAKVRAEHALKRLGWPG